MGKVVLPVSGECLSENFTRCFYYLIYEIENRKIVSKKVEIFPKGFLLGISDWPEKLGITDVIAHKIDEASFAEFNCSKINLFVGVRISQSDLLIEEYLNGTLRSDTHYFTESSSVSS